jgi:hypothetical protein
MSSGEANPDIKSLIKNYKRIKNISKDFLRILKLLILLEKKFPEIFGGIIHFDQPDFEFNKLQVLVEKYRNNQVYDKFRCFINLDRKNKECNIKINVALKNSNFDYISFIYPSKIRVYKNCSQDEIDFNIKYKI